MDFNANNYFEIFSLPECFRVDSVSLNQQYKILQAQYHPDKFVSADDRSRLQALQISSMINDAFETLKSPLKRAAYLLTLHEVNPEENNQAHLGTEFLLEHMSFRDELENIARSESIDALEELKSEVINERNGYLADFHDYYENENYKGAKPVYSKLQFVYKLLAEIDLVEEKLLGY